MVSGTIVVKKGTNLKIVYIVIHIDIVQPDERDRWKGGTGADLPEKRR
jgi:hypothetical protein